MPRIMAGGGTVAARVKEAALQEEMEKQRVKAARKAREAEGNTAFKFMDNDDYRRSSDSPSAAQPGMWQDLDLDFSKSASEKVNEYQPATCQSLPFTFTFWIVFVVTQGMHHKQEEIFKTQQTITSGLTTKASASRTFAVNDTGTADEVTVVSSTRDISTVTDTRVLLNYINESLVYNLWAESPVGRGNYLERNRVVGGVRMKQKRLATKDCTTFVLARQVYNMSCFSKESGSDSSPLGVNTEARQIRGFTADENSTYTYWLDIALTQTQALEHLQVLRNERWLSAPSETFNVQSLLVNVQTLQLAFFDIKLTLDRTGTLTAKSITHILPMNVYESIPLLVLDIFLLVAVAGLFFIEVFFLVHACRKSRKSTGRLCICPKPKVNLVRLVNWAMILIGAGFSIAYGFLATELDELSGMISEVPAPPKVNLVGSSNIFGYGSEWIGRHDALNIAYNKVERLAEYARWTELAAFWYSLVITAKFFESFEANPRLSVVNATLRYASTDMIHFGLVFILVWLNFTLGGHFLFGLFLKEWSSMPPVFNTTFRVLLGDWDFDAMFTVTPSNSSVWFWAYMLIIVITMLQMFLAIILDVYQRIKGKTEESETLWDQAWYMLEDALRRKIDEDADLEEGRSGDGRKAKQNLGSMGLVQQLEAEDEQEACSSDEDLDVNQVEELAETIQSLSEGFSELLDLPIRFRQVEDTLERALAVKAQAEKSRKPQRAQSRPHAATVDATLLPGQIESNSFFGTPAHARVRIETY